MRLGHKITGWLAVALTLAATAPAHAQTGLVPLIDLGAGAYQGFQGGLYPGGVNTPPPAHLAAALAGATSIVPRDATGNPDPGGWIGMIAVGMSNTTHEFGAFERNADADTARNARVVLLDTGFGGQTATAIANPNATYWTTMMQRLSAMGLTAAQVQVAWLKEAEAQPPNNFPLHAQALRDTLVHVVQDLHAKFPNLRVCYLSSRIYGGYAPQGSLNPEPQAYESGFSVKWLIENQINGDPALNYGALPGDVRSPLLLWGPYLWADGPTPRSDGLVWLPGDLEGDHTHPSAAGEQKVSGLLAGFFASDATAASWWPAQADARLVTVDAVQDAYVSAAAPTTNFGASPDLLTAGGASPIDTYARFSVGAAATSTLLAKLSLRVEAVGGGAVRQVEDSGWLENVITYDDVPAIGPTLVTLPQSSRDGTIGANVTPWVRTDPDHELSFALTSPATGQASYHSKEGGEPPRLVLVVSRTPLAVVEPGLGAAALLAIAPNPSLRVTRITFALPAAGDAELAILGLDGRRVRRLVDGPIAAGRHDVAWDGLDQRGRAAPPGVYFARLVSRGVTTSVRMVRIR